MTPRLLAAAAAALALAALPSPAAAVTKPRPIKVTSASVSTGPMLAGGRVVYARTVEFESAAIYSATRRGRKALARFNGDFGSVRIDDIAASSRRIAFAGAEEYEELRDTYDGAYFFGTLRADGKQQSVLSECTELDACFYRSASVEIDGNTVAWGPFSGGPTGQDEAIFVKDFSRSRKDAPTMVVADDAADFKFAGHFIAYRKTNDFDHNADTIVLLDTRTGAVVRELAPAEKAPSYQNGFAFDVDSKGRVAVAWRVKGPRTAYGVYGTNGRLKTFAARSAKDSTEDIWLSDNGRVAFERYRSKTSGFWEVTNLSGRVTARMRVPRGGELGDFDGSCLAWSARRAIYVAAAVRAPRGSICRR